MGTYETMRAAHTAYSNGRACKIARRAAGGAVDGIESAVRLDRGGKALKGRHHPHVTVNVVSPQAPVAPPRPAPMGLAPMAAAPPSMPPRPMMPPGGAPGMPPGAGAPMLRPPGMKRGGRAAGGNISEPADPPRPKPPPKMTAGALSGEGRLQKARVGVKGLA